MGEIKTPIEIERKFLVMFVPGNLGNYPRKDIIQGYLVTSADGSEARVRRKGSEYFLAVKSGAGSVRMEVETEITRDQFDVLWLATEGKRLEKTRYEIPYESGIYELDIYFGSLEGLVAVEVEFRSEEDCEKFVPPSWFGREITDDMEFKNQRLAQEGLPRGFKAGA